MNKAKRLTFKMCWIWIINFLYWYSVRHNTEVALDNKVLHKIHKKFKSVENFLNQPKEKRDPTAPLIFNFYLWWLWYAVEYKYKKNDHVLNLCLTLQEYFRHIFFIANLKLGIQFFFSKLKFHQIGSVI